MKKPYFLMYTTSQTHDIDPIDHGHILQPDRQQDRTASVEKRDKIIRAIGLTLALGFIVLTFVLSYVL